MHRQGVQRNVRAAPRVRCGGQIVGVDLARHLEDGQRDGLGHFRAAGEPLGIGPALQHGFGLGIALVGLVLDVMELVKHQQRVFQAVGGLLGDQCISVIQQLNHWADVVATQHRAKQLRGMLAGNQRALLGTVGHSGQVAGLDLGRVVHASRHAVRDEVDQKSIFTSRRSFEQFDHFTGLLGRQGQRWNANRSTVSDMRAVGLQEIRHGFLPLFKWRSKTGSNQKVTYLGAEALGVAG